MNPINATTVWTIAVLAFFRSMSGMAQENESDTPPIDSLPRINKIESLQYFAKNAPPQFARLIDRGSVRFEEDDKFVRELHRSAMTIYTIASKYKNSYRADAGTDPDTGAQALLVTVKNYPGSIQIEHRIKFLADFQPTSPWASPLLIHEMDHVAISCDPRAKAIAEAIEFGTFQFYAPLAGKRNFPKNIQQLIRDRCRERRTAVEQLIERYYVRLDQDSNHGLKELHDRQVFFRSLYSIDDLTESKFIYLDDVRDAVDSISAKDVDAHYGL